MSAPPEPEPGGAAWETALRVATLLSADPHGCGGVRLRARPGPVRDAWLAALSAALPPGRPVRRMPAGIADDRLLGGLDLPATLATGRPVLQRGLLAEADGGLLIVPMAERLDAGIAARLASCLDTGIVALARDGLAARLPARIGLVLLDEGDDEEGPPDALLERLAFRLDLDGVSVRDVAAGPKTRDAAPTSEARSLSRSGAEKGVRSSDGAALIESLCSTACTFGVASLRAPILALRIARLAAALDGAREPEETHAVEAAALVLAPRATRLPEPRAEAADRPEPGSTDAPTERDGGADRPLDDVVLAAIRAAIPPGLLALLACERVRNAKAGKAGAPAASARSGRAVGSRPGDPRRARLDLVATLRAAAPWQRLRTSSTAGRIVIRTDDLRITRYRQRSETTTIFAVDASGSSAIERLAEAKGAVEGLLAESYARRDRVALVAFRGAGADIVLPPTRSLVRAKRGLAGLPGGGGTPLAAGLDAALALALAVRRAGGTPLVVLLTDGRANIARSGEPGRAQAAEDALAAARAFRGEGLPALLIDTAFRPQDPARRLAEAMAARYLPLPQADAARLGAAVRAAAPAR
ncbi:magnesium chelatase subunit D [Methylobacterium durans]|uniref:magnesium chelatase subunit D n=1 Tax=Methylobacterium durans TaxID=2202825 RepID=UPI002AFE1BD4|nr:magnesium chelatase subunit D [Methylobacterium durans]MEA1830677.1 magnesium chelatase subunit D [Methylobacterium durans]